MYVNTVCRSMFFRVLRTYCAGFPAEGGERGGGEPLAAAGAGWTSESALVRAGGGAGSHGCVVRGQYPGGVVFSGRVRVGGAGHGGEDGVEA